MRFFLLLLFLFSQVYSFAANDSIPPVKKIKPEHQVFINTTFFLKQIISLSNQNIAISPYIVGYKFFYKKHGFRFSIGGNLSKKTDFPDSVSTRITENNSLDYRLGYEFRYNFGKRWTLFTGVDMVAKQSFLKVKSNSSIDIITTKTDGISIGGGPMLGIQFNINNRIALFTEVAFYYSYTWNKRKVDSQNFKDLNVDRSGGTEYKGEFLLPTSLYFVFKF